MYKVLKKKAPPQNPQKKTVKMIGFFIIHSQTDKQFHENRTSFRNTFLFSFSKLSPHFGMNWCKEKKRCGDNIMCRIFSMHSTLHILAWWTGQDNARDTALFCIPIGPLLDYGLKGGTPKAPFLLSCICLYFSMFVWTSYISHPMNQEPNFWKTWP